MTTNARSQLYLGVDVGTTGTKALVVDGDGAVHGRGQATYRLESPRPGHFVQDAEDWLKAVIASTRTACAGMNPRQIRALSVSAQGGTLIALDQHRQPLAPARSWLDRRATESAVRFEHVFGHEDFYRRTGWPIAPNNTAAQLLDLASNEPELFASASCFCDTAAYVNGWLTGTPTIDTNVAGIGQLLNVRSKAWDEDILELIGVTPARLPDVAEPGTAIARLDPSAAAALGLQAGTAVGAGAQDQYCAALGANAIAPGDVLLSTGTAWVMLAVAAAPHKDPEGGIGSGRHLTPGLWGHFGEVSNGGVSIEWARRLLNHGDHEPLPVEELNQLLDQTPLGSDGLSFFPFFDGTSPYDTLETSRGSLIGLSLSHDHRHVLRAVAEGVAFAMRILLEHYYSSTRRAAGSPVVVGGATRSREWIQLLADVLGAELLVSSEPDTACVGAAILAATAVGDAPDAPSGAQRMACTRSSLSPDGAASHHYDGLFASYERDAKRLGKLYAAHAHLTRAQAT